MNRKQMIFTAAALLMLYGGSTAYGYWVDKVETRCNISFAIPVHIQVRSNEEVHADIGESWEEISSLGEETGTEEAYGGTKEMEDMENGVDWEEESKADGRTEGTEEEGDTGSVQDSEEETEEGGEENK